MAPFPAILPAALSLFFVRDAPAHAMPLARSFSTTTLGVALREPRIDAWAERLAPVDVKNVATGHSAPVRLYAVTGEIDEGARAEFERVATRDGQAHAMAERLEQLVFKAAYHFKAPRISIVSGWREHAGRHSSGEALDFKLEGVYAPRLAAYLRGLPRAGVGIYTHPRTQFVHLDVRDPSYHWLDASPPGVKWRERQLRDPHGTRRDAAWTLESDLPL
jgi:uncharacterized protein YcbK (DUF882 family)